MRFEWDIPQVQEPSNAQHQLMAQHYRDIIEQALREFNNSYSDAVYKNLAWVGSQGTVAWNNQGADTTAIEQVVENFNNSHPKCSN